MNHAAFLFDQATMNLRLGRKEAAFDELTEVIRLDPTIADAWALRARLTAEAGRPFDAMLQHGFALQQQPDRYDFWCNRGIDAMAARMYKESAESFEKSIALRESFEAHYNYGNLLSFLMKVDEAVEHFQRAYAIGGDAVGNEQIHANLGTAMIGQGKWQEGFQRFRHRFNAPGFPPRPRFNYPIWHGEDLKGKTIMLYVEQGFGDEILGLRFAKPVKDAGARVILAVRPPMYRLARSLAADVADALILMYDPCPWEPDFMSALIDVPAWLPITPENVPLSAGYLKAVGDERGFRLDWKPGFRVGICWASGNRPHQPMVVQTHKQKSLTLEHLLPLKRKGVVLVNLQKEHQIQMKDHGILDPMIGGADFLDTAYWINELDLVVSVDTSVAHLAGAIGKPVWNLVRFDALWPWMRETGKTCWYDSMTIYRQPAPFDWQTTLNQLYGDFNKLLEQRAAA